MSNILKSLFIAFFVFSCAPTPQWPALEEPQSGMDAASLVQALDWTLLNFRWI